MMGKAAEAVAKKKGHRSSRIYRPAPSDLSPPPPPEPRRNLRPRQRRLSAADDDDGDESEEEERGRRKLKLVLNLPFSPADRRPGSPEIRRSPSPDSAAASTSSASSASVSSLVDEDAVKPPKKRRINGFEDGFGSDGSGHHEERKRNGPSRSRRSVSVMSTDPPKGTPLPERTTLESILDKLQKKDIYRVFSQPVDPEELPDYYDLIEHPMDFGTIRKKLASNAYCSFEQFEDDVFLICSNAMHYNAPDTVYFRQARAIQDMGRKKFQILRADAKCSETVQKSEEKIRFSSMEKKVPKQFDEKIKLSSMEKKSVQKQLRRTEQKPLCSDICSGDTRASPGDTGTLLSTVRANDVEKLSTADGLVDVNSSLGESKLEKVELVDANSLADESKPEKTGIVDGSYSLGECRPEKADELLERCSPSQHTEKPFFVDENRRLTYNKSEEELISEPDSLFDVFVGETKQLADVGLYSANSYARSLVHFAALLGPIGWKVASKEIEKSLPAGTKYGPGWVGEYEPLPTPILCLENYSHQQLRNNSRKDKGNQEKPKATQNGDAKIKSRLITGNSHVACNPGEGALFGRTGKQGLFSVPAETGIGNAMLQKRIDQVGIDSSRPCTNVQEHPRACSLASVSCNPIETTSRRSEFHSEARNQGLFSIPTETPPIASIVMSPRQRNQEQRSECHSEARKQVLLGVPPEIHARTSNATTYQHKERSLATTFNYVEHSSSNRVSGETALQRPNCHPDAEKPGWFGFSAEAQPRMNNPNLQLPIDISKMYNNLPEQFRVHNISPETTDFHSDAARSRFLGMISRNGNQAQHVSTDACGLVVDGASNDNLAGAYSSSQAIDFRLMGLGMNNFNAGGVYAMPPIPPPRRENPQAWMSYGNEPQIGTGLLHNSIWRAPAVVHGAAEESQNGGLICYPHSVGADLSRFRGRIPWQGLVPHVEPRQKKDVLPPDLNFGFQAPGSPARPSSGVLVDSQQPDLALQL